MVSTKPLLRRVSRPCTKPESGVPLSRLPKIKEIYFAFVINFRVILLCLALKIVYSGEQMNPTAKRPRFNKLLTPPYSSMGACALNYWERTLKGNCIH